MMQHYLLTPVDTWFFKESRSMEGGHAAERTSQFPPSTKTMLGALRREIGNRYFAQHGGSWRAFSSHHGLTQVIGFGNEDYASLQAQGVWLYHQPQKQLHFPAPLNLVKQAGTTAGGGDADNAKYAFFALSENLTNCDLGKVRLPMLRSRLIDGIEKRDPPVENAWISEQGLAAVLSGTAPAADQLKTPSDIKTDEPRLGIGRDFISRKTKQGALFVTQHLRLQPGWSVYMGLTINVAHQSYLPNAHSILRLGGEARMAELTHLAQPIDFKDIKPTATADSKLLVLYLLTPLPDWRKDASSPALPNVSFKQIVDGKQHKWQGKILDVDITIISAIIGKPERIGGWDMATHQSTPVRSYLPAGSCWYIESNSQTETQKIIDTLHGNYLTTGRERALGLGQIVVGLEPKHSSLR